GLQQGPRGVLTGVDDEWTVRNTERLRKLRATKNGTGNPLQRVFVLFNNRYAGYTGPGSIAAGMKFPNSVRKLPVPINAAGTPEEDVTAALATIDAQKVPATDGVLVLPDPLTNKHKQLIVNHPALSNIPAMFGTFDSVGVGGLAS